MMFFRFPHTQHTAWLGEGQPRDDKVLSSAEAADLLARVVILKEKAAGISDIANFCLFRLCWLQDVVRRFQ